MKTGKWLLGSTVVLATSLVLVGAEQMPREDVVEFPAVGQGLAVHNLFQSNMVIQRDKPVGFWGWAEPGETVTVSFDGNHQKAQAGADRKWRVSFPAMTVRTEPLEVSIKGQSKSIVLENILVGDVWVLGGQSNMEFPLSKVENGQLEIVSANYPQIRILTVPAVAGPEKAEGFARLHQWSDWSKRHYRKGDWDVCSPEVVKELSAIGYVFGRRLHMASQVPIGIVDASRGGSTVETWTPDPVLREIEAEPVKAMLADWDEKVASYDPQADLENQIKRHEQWVAKMTKEGKPIPADRKAPTEPRPGPAMNHNRPGSCYAGMIGPLEGLAVKGVIFHQGYNNCFNGTEGAKMYREVFPHMITAWRRAFGDPELPFGILSLCTEGAKQNLSNFTEMTGNVGPYIRAAQYETFLEFYKAGDENIGFTSVYDLRRRWYHPQLKVPAGERIARWALATEYGFDAELMWKPPFVEDMTIVDGKITLKMDSNVSAIDDGGVIEGFAIAGDDRVFHPATADHLITGKDGRGRPKKDSTVLVLSSPMVAEPLHYRYAWGRSPMGNLQQQRMSDVPLATQRSDDWPLEEVMVDGEMKTFEGRQLRGVLRKFDEQRLMEEARTRLDGQAQSAK